MKIAIIGLGYVGLPLAIKFAEAGCEVYAVDIDQEKIDYLLTGKSYIKHIPSDKIKTLVDQGKLKPMTDFSVLRQVESISICVPTPLNKYREPELKYVLHTAKSVGEHLTEDTLVVLESTVHPGCTEEDLKPVLEKESGLIAGQDFHLAFSPEREDPGNKDFTLDQIPKVIGGYTESCKNKAVEIYSKIIKKLVPVANCRTAEATKLMENIFRSVNIALVNELKVIYEKMGIDIWEVIEAAKTKPFGYMPFYPGPGLGGHCIPIDPFYLTWKAREYGKNTRFIELAGEINTAMPNYVIEKVKEALNDQGKSVKGSKILIMGVAYKADVDDDRESPAFPIMKELEHLGAKVVFHDPWVDTIHKKRDYEEFYGQKSQELSVDKDLILVLTAHSSFKSIDFSKFDCPIVDTRGIVQQKQEIHLHRA